MKIKNYKQFLNENNSNEFILIDGKNYSKLNSIGEPISDNIESIIKFYEWFGNSKTIDSNNRPIVFYHTSNNKFDTFEPSRFGKMGSGIYFTSILDDIKSHDKYDNSILYKCYLKIENPLEIENPFSKRNDDNDGIIAFKGKSGEEVKVYNPSQIKSIDNDGSWDIDDKNIYS